MHVTYELVHLRVRRMEYGMTIIMPRARREPCFDFLFDTSRNIPNVRVFSSKAMVQNFYWPRPHVEIKITLNLVLIPDSPST